VVLALDAPVYVYVALVAVVTRLLQGSLFREALGYVSRRSSAQSEPATRPA
jgi:hypothetical protein